MNIEATLITGLMLGFEYVDLRSEEYCQHIVIDILFARFILTW